MRPGAPGAKRTHIWTTAAFVAIATIVVLAFVVIGRATLLVSAVAIAFVLTAKGLRRMS